MISFITSGESHGKGMFVTLSGVPSNLKVDPAAIDRELARRQQGYGRGTRMRIETDKAEILSGVMNGRTTGAPVTLAVWNKDWENWKDKKTTPVLAPRPGHADLTGVYKFGLKDDIRMVLERSSARETAARVAGGALVRQLLKEFHIGIFSHVIDWGGVAIDTTGMSYKEINEKAEKSELRSACDAATEKKIKGMIDQAKIEGNTIGGTIETVIHPVPPLLGSYQVSSEKLDSRIAATVLGIQAVKGIEFGLGFGYSGTHGKDAHDEIFYNREKKLYYRNTNHAGGIEGGMSNGEPIVFRAVMKPIPTLMTSLNTVNISTKAGEEAVKERSDVTAVGACGVVIENAVTYDIANALIRRYGGDDLELVLSNFRNDDALKEFRWKE
jgi:chorismate synthase